MIKTASVETKLIPRLRESGQSIFEVTVAVAIIALVLVTVISIAAISVRNTSFSKNKTLASRMSQETIEWLRGQRDTDWNTFSAFSIINKRCFTTLSWDEASIGSCSIDQKITGTPFSREIELSIVSPDTIEADVRVFWNDSQGYHETKTSTIFTNWKGN